MYNIDMTDVAKADILEAAKYIKHELQNPIAADNLLDNVDDAVQRLCTMPEINPPVRDEFLAGLGFRMTQVGNYLLFYRIDKKKVTVSRFLYGRRNWQYLLKADILL